MERRSSLGPIGLLGIALSSCATSLPTSSLDKPLPAAFRGVGAIEAIRPAPGRYWKVFADPELNALIAAALLQPS